MTATRPAPFRQPNILPLAGSWWRPAYVLAEPYSVEWVGRDGQRLRLDIPAGARHDGSTEWLLVGILHLLPWGGLLALALRLGADGPHRAAALAHDWLYRTHAVSRAEADHAFRVLAQVGGLTWWQAWIRWAALRAIGLPWWARKKAT